MPYSTMLCIVSRYKRYKGSVKVVTKYIFSLTFCAILLRKLEPGGTRVDGSGGLVGKLLTQIVRDVGLSPACL